MFYGLLQLSVWQHIGVTLILTHITIAAVTIFLHRSQAHRALKLHAIPSHFFRAWLWLTTGMVTKAWTAIHRKHHAKCETSEDPHSPQIFGLSTIMWKGAELYRIESCNAETLARYGQGTPDDWLENNLYSPHSAKGIMLMLLMNIVLFGVPGICIWAVQMAWIPFFAAGIVNGVGHYWGYRNIECPDAATNIVPWGIIIGGEELHNNHHAHPSSAKLSSKWFEFDLGWVYIKILSYLGLAEIKRVAPQPKIVPGKSYIDADALRAIITNRFQVLTHYSKKVILPVFMQESKNISGSRLKQWLKMKRIIVREKSLIDEAGLSQLNKICAHNQALNVVFQFKNRLYEIWNKTTASQKELIEALQEWCHQAEMTGISKLQDFTDYLKGYSLTAPTR